MRDSSPAPVYGCVTVISVELREHTGILAHSTANKIWFVKFLVSFDEYF